MPAHNVNRRNSRRSNRFAHLVTALSGLMFIGLLAVPANASAPNRTPPSYTSIAAAQTGGYWVQLTSGTVAIDGAPQYESVAASGSIAAIPGTNKYWVVTTHGFIHARGGAPELCGGYLGNCSGFGGKGNLISGAAASPNGEGLWAVDTHRHVWGAGNVVSYGDVSGDDQTPSGIVATASGQGYYIVMSDGGVHARGDAVFYGSTGGKRPGGHDITGLAISYDLFGKQVGYWLVGDGGEVLTFGDAPFLGSTGGHNGGSFVTSIVTPPDGLSYAWVHADGQIELSMTLPKVTIESTAPVGGVWDLTSSFIRPGVTIERDTANGSTSQQWYLWPTSYDGKIVQIVNIYSDMCADVTSDTRGAYLVQYPCKGKQEGWDNQRFTLTTHTSGCGRDFATCVDFSPVNSPGYRVITGGNSILTLTSIGEKYWTLLDVTSAGTSQEPEP